MPSDARSDGEKANPEPGVTPLFVWLKDYGTQAMAKGKQRTAFGSLNILVALGIGLLLWPLLCQSSSHDEAWSLFGGSGPNTPSSKSSSSHVWFASSSSSEVVVPQTKIKAHSRGFTALENVYLLDGIWYIVSANSSGEVPLLGYIDCGEVTVPDQIDLSPQQLDRHIRLLHPDDVPHIFNSSAAAIMRGLTWAIREKFFIHHFGHFAPEIFLGSWFTTVAGWSKIAPFPERIFFTLEKDVFWRDGPGLNEYLVRAAFPSISYLHLADWQSFARSGPLVMFEKLVIVDRQAGHRAPANAASNKMVAQLQVDFPTLAGGDGGWWQPVRRSIVASVHASLAHTRGLDETARGVTITYISRQAASRRKLRAVDHTRLVGALDAFADRKGVHVNVVELEGLSPAEQIRIASTTDIFISLHGNGMSMLLFGPTTPNLSAVIEILLPGSWARDFELPARMLGRRHFGIWDDVVLRGEEMEPAMVMPSGFHGSDIPVTAMTVVKLLESIVDGKAPPAHKSQLR